MYKSIAYHLLVCAEDNTLIDPTAYICVWMHPELYNICGSSLPRHEEYATVDLVSISKTMYYNKSSSFIPSLTKLLYSTQTDRRYELQRAPAS